MKHLFIILSILLLSSPVIGQENGVLYQYETSSGYVFKRFGDGKVQPKYKGETSKGKPNGFGVLIYPYGKKSVVGEWKNGKEWNTKHAKKDGTLIGKFENGEWKLMWGILFGRYENYKLVYYKNGGDRDVKYLGGIRDGRPDVQGEWSHPQGSKYVGEFKDGKRNGQGIETYLSGQKYEGQWRDGKIDGEGKFFYSGGSKYIKIKLLEIKI